MTADPVLVTRLAEHTMRQSGFTGWSCRGCDWIADPSVPDSPVDQHAAHLAAEVEGRVQERIAAELDEAADEVPWDQYAEERHDVSGWLRDRAAAHRPEGGSDE